MDATINYLLTAALGTPLMLGLAGLLGLGRRAGRLYLVAASWAPALPVAAALGLALAVSQCGPIDRVYATRLAGLPVSLGVYVDALSALLLVLTATLGLVVCRYSLRYLDGAAGQARFLSWVLLTLAAVLGFLCSRDLLALVLCWSAVSAGLHQLLTFFPERPAAVRAAWKKFVVSRIGDAFLLAAVVLTWRAYGALDLPQLFALASSGAGGAPEGSWAAVCLAFGAMTKSAQFPFHAWLPETMECPTPVSALMHAGIINAGGFLIVRLSPLVAGSPVALDLLLLSGALTALLGSVVMLTQTDIKRGLAYSTISQMGFMMMQCGLGAFSAAVLHLVAHGLYKAHAFLAAGSACTATGSARGGPARGELLAGCAALALSLAAVAGAMALAGVRAWDKPGGLVLATFLTAGAAVLVFRGLREPGLRLAQRALVVSLAPALVLAYLAVWKMLDAALAPFLDLSRPALRPSGLNQAISAVVAVAVVAVLLAGWAARRLPAAWGLRLYALALNGFHAAELLQFPTTRRTSVPSLSGRSATAQATR